MGEKMDDYLDRPLYLCNPFINTTCKKTCCKWEGRGNCEHTTDLEAAMMDMEGNPILGETGRQWRERIMGERRERRQGSREDLTSHV